MCSDQSNALANEKGPNRSLTGQTRHNHHVLAQLYSTIVPSNISDSQMIPFNDFQTSNQSDCFLTTANQKMRTRKRA